ncbi:MAG: tRNA epoxyqueuosine(34) reductase QueG [Phycisphaerales bacterium]|nr:tRNA epoxyqueuosine(34) reductase QueG [Phycisphaerales bacterium]
MPGADDLTRDILSRCEALGFAIAGVCDARPSDHGDHLRQWLAAGKHSSMAYLEELSDTRLDPARVMPDVKSIIVVADRYAERAVREVGGATSAGAGSDAAEAMSESEEPRGVIARYARGRDYHDVIKRRLHRLADELRAEIPGSEFRTVVDSAPVMEREHAARAGVGWVGKHTLVLHPRLGSWFLLGCVLTNVRLTPTPDAALPADHCGTCTRCIDACPTGAITERSVDASRCISYLTIERELPIDPAFFAPIGDRLFGCDICQEVCPYNARPESAEPSAERANPAYEARRDSFPLLEILNWSQSDRSAALGPTPLKRASLEMFKRNALIAAGNALANRDHAPLRARIIAMSTDITEPELVRITAQHVLARLAH